MEKNMYEIPQMELLMFRQEDVICTSITDDNDTGFDDNNIEMLQWN